MLIFIENCLCQSKTSMSKSINKFNFNLKIDLHMFCIFTILLAYFILLYTINSLITNFTLSIWQIFHALVVLIIITNFIKLVCSKHFVSSNSLNSLTNRFMMHLLVIKYVCQNNFWRNSYSYFNAPAFSRETFILPK